MQQETKGANPNAARDALISGAINVPGPYDYVRDPEFLAIFRDNFILLSLGETVGVSSEFGTLFYWARLIQEPPSSLSSIGINREGAYIDESPQALMTDGSFHEITSSDNGIHERIRKRLFASP